jgi:hypothetical protein
MILPHAAKCLQHAVSYQRQPLGACKGQKGSYNHSKQRKDSLALGIGIACSESAVYGLGSIQKLSQIRKEAAKRGLNKAPSILGPRPSKPKPFKWSPQRKAWVLPFLGAADLLLNFLRVLLCE